MSQKVVIALMCVAAGAAALSVAFASADDQPVKDETRLVVLWTSGDREVAIRMAFMYTHAAGKAKWWDRVTLVVWGPSARLLSEDVELQEKVKKMQASGIDVKACIVCADSYGVTPQLRELGIEVKPMGRPLSGMLQSGWTLLSV